MSFLTLKAVGLIDCHYMTDRLQRVELKIFVCGLLKKQSHYPYHFKYITFSETGIVLLCYSSVSVAEYALSSVCEFLHVHTTLENHNYTMCPKK